MAYALCNLGLARQERIAVYLPKRIETVISFFAATMAGGVMVPVNPVLKAPQVAHILRDCNARILITSRDRLNALYESLSDCHDLDHLILIDENKTESGTHTHYQVLTWKELDRTSKSSLPVIIDADMAAILYTSGSTGKPKGVVLSHRNMVAGAKSVSTYLKNNCEDRLLAALPFSFDYGFSQLTTAFNVGACTVLMDYLLPRDIIKAITKYKITGLAAVPPLWVQLGQLEWPEEAQRTLRYITNSGGAMPVKTLQALREALPTTQPYLMYGLTEAFRSTYLPPEELERRPTSMGRAIPNAEIMVVREDGTCCAPGEPGELVHRGALVAMGYWNDPNKTAERFRSAPGQPGGIPLDEIAVWSGDTVKMDEDGFLYFIGRKDDMIKTSGYRVSPTEIEEVIYTTGKVGEAVALGIPHPVLGQAIVVVATPKVDDSLDIESIMATCKQELPNYMIPTAIEQQTSLPRNPNGKIDRKVLFIDYENMFEE
jgi:acyl-CoA ligase (AMP-forming) (exosortase A-associated)